MDANQLKALAKAGLITPEEYMAAAGEAASPMRAGMKSPWSLYSGPKAASLMEDVAAQGAGAGFLNKLVGSSASMFTPGLVNNDPDQILMDQLFKHPAQSMPTQAVEPSLLDKFMGADGEGGPRAAAGELEPAVKKAPEPKPASGAQTRIKNFNAVNRLQRDDEVNSLEDLRVKKRQIERKEMRQKMKDGY